MGDEVVGCVGAIIDARLAAGVNGEIVSLVVLEPFRGRGIGKRLVEVAEAWLAAFVGRIRVRANTRRVDAHRFYADAGYQEVKTQKIFQKALAK
jgi:GNAT superfamily N-acetyltransferase